MITIAGPSTRAHQHTDGVCPEHERGVTGGWTALSFADPYGSRRPRPDHVSILDPQRASTPPRWSP